MRKLIYSGLIVSGLAGLIGCDNNSVQELDEEVQKINLKEAKNISPVIRITSYWHESPVALCTADMNGDQREDIIVSSSDIRNSEIKNIYVFLNNGDGSYTPQTAPIKVEKAETEKR